MGSRLARVAVATALLAAAPLAVGQAASPAQAAPAPAAARKAVRSAHPRVEGDQNCRDCHAKATPDSFRSWSESKHGLDLVTCSVCHGSTGADFRRRPASDLCAGCHPAASASLATRFMKGKTCFQCHPGHVLDPHATGQHTVAKRVNADHELERELRMAGPVNGPNPAAEAAAKANAPAPAAPAAGSPPAAPPAGAPGAGAAPLPTKPAPAAPAAPAAPGKEKDLGTAQPHPPTDRP